MKTKDEACIIVSGISDKDSLEKAKAIKAAIGKCKISIDHPDPPEPDILFEREFDRINDAFNNLYSMVENTHVFGSGEDVYDNDMVTVKQAKRELAIARKDYDKVCVKVEKLLIAINACEAAIDKAEPIAAISGADE